MWGVRDITSGSSPPSVAKFNAGAEAYRVDGVFHHAGHSERKSVWSVEEQSQLFFSYVSMSGGSMSGSGSNRVVTVTTVGKAAISVVADGKKSDFEFRVKEIPNPIFKVGPGGTRMTSQSFKNQQYCRAELENFDFAASFSVVSATVYFSGANFSNVQTVQLTGNNLSSLQSLMQRVGPGTSVTFDQVKVKGPDGKDRSIQGVGIVLY